MGTASIPIGSRFGPLRSKRLLALASDEQLVQQIRRGNDAAFEVAFERYGKAILSFSRHMLGSPEEAEDAVQHTFASAHTDLLRDDRAIRLKPWLYTIARNRCLSLLRARREHESTDDHELATVGLDAQVEQRAELQDLLRDIATLPDEQRVALLLSEVGDLSHAEVAGVLGCEVGRVKALVFRARTGLIQRRDGRDTPCEQVREQLANLSGGSLRRNELRHHLSGCAGCRDYREQVKQQRRMLAVALPVIPSLNLKSSVLSAAGLGGSAGGGALAGGGVAASTAAGGAGLGAVTPGVGSALLTKLAIVGLLAGGGVVAAEQVFNPSDRAASPAGAHGKQAGSDSAGARGGAYGHEGPGALPPQAHGKALRTRARRGKHKQHASGRGRLTEHGRRVRRHRLKVRKQGQGRGSVTPPTPKLVKPAPAPKLRLAPPAQLDSPAAEGPAAGAYGQTKLKLK